jgi:uncharacterized lipoprotein YddW (UPF0748 family)
MESLIWMGALMVLAYAIRVAEGGLRREPAVAAVFGGYAFEAERWGSGWECPALMTAVTRALQTAGVAHAAVTDMDIAAGALKPYRAAVLTGSRILPEEAAQGIAGYVEEGGKLIAFGAMPRVVLEALGLAEAGTHNGDFCRADFRGGGLAGMPEQVWFGARRVTEVRGAREGTQLLGEWVEESGRPLGVPVLATGEGGMVVGAVPGVGDYPNLARFLLAALEHFLPELREGAGARALAASFGRVAAMTQRVGDSPRAQEELQRIEQALVAVRQGLAAGGGAEALTAALGADEAVERARALAARERKGEFRAVWLHDPCGIPGWGWKRSIRHLKEHGFNAIIANIARAGVVHYQSDLLPVAPEVEREGDQIAECLKWCREYSIELHVWKVNHNLSRAPAEFVSRLREEGRLQQRCDGKEVRWLCPSDDRNFRLERDSMLEMAEKYDVHGIHFDYIRYLDADVCYCPGCCERFSRAQGIEIERWPEEVLAEPLQEAYADWRRKQITRLVRAVSEGVRRTRPGTMVSAAVFGWPGAYQKVMQDWKQWIEEGLLDFVCPMNYTWDVDALDEVVRRQVEAVCGHAPLYIGIGEFVIPESEALLDQIERARSLGADGFVCFDYRGHLGMVPGRMAALRQGLTAHDTFPAHPAPRARFSLPEGPGDAASVELVEAGNYPLSVQRAQGEALLETTEGECLASFGEVSLGQGPLTVSLPPHPGRCRLAIYGSVELGDGSPRDFVVRSRPFTQAAS